MFTTEAEDEGLTAAALTEIACKAELPLIAVASALAIEFKLSPDWTVYEMACEPPERLASYTVQVRTSPAATVPPRASVVVPFAGRPQRSVSLPPLVMDGR